MRRSTFIEASEKILSDLKDAEIVSALEILLDLQRRAEGPGNIDLTPFQKYSIATSKYSVTERQIFEKFNLQTLINPSFWIKYFRIKPDNSDMEELYTVRSDTLRMTSVLPKVLDLLRYERIEQLKSGNPETPEGLRGQDLFTLIIPETKDQLSSPKRITTAIESISDFYYVIASLNEKNTDDITIIACDSGSDKSFDFTGLPQIIQGVRETILDIWDRVVMHRANKSRAALESISNSLPVLQEIKAMEESGAISPEMAELLRRKTVSACDHFIESGAIIIEMERTAELSPRRLMAPTPKLLAGPSSQRHDEGGAVLTDVVISDVRRHRVRRDDAEPETQTEDLRGVILELRKELDQLRRSPSARKSTNRKRASSPKKAPTK